MDQAVSKVASSAPFDDLLKSFWTFEGRSRRRNMVVTRKRWLVDLTIPITASTLHSSLRYIGSTWSNQITRAPVLIPAASDFKTTFRFTIVVWYRSASSTL